MIVAALFPGARWYLAGRRIHHGHSGLALLTCGIATRNRWLMLTGALLCADDVMDWRAWCRMPVHRRYGG
jgi:hypothetical protein